MKCPHSLVIKTSKNSITCCGSSSVVEPTDERAGTSAPKAPKSPYYIELTITLKPYMYSKTLDEQISATKKRLISVLHGFNKSIVIELTKDYNIHYHCLLTEKKVSSNPRLRIADKLRGEKWAGRRTIQGVQYYESYIKYMNKEIQETNKCITQSAIIIDDFSILGFQWETEDKVPELPSGG